MKFEVTSVNFDSFTASKLCEFITISTTDKEKAEKLCNLLTMLGHQPAKVSQTDSVYGHGTFYLLTYKQVGI